jgi:hypothetical protein
VRVAIGDARVCTGIIHLSTTKLSLVGSLLASLPTLLPTDIGCGTSPLALDKTRQHTLLAIQTSTVATKTCLDYLHSHTRTMRPSTASPTYVQPIPNGYWVWHPRPSLSAPSQALQHATHTARDSNLGSGNHDMSGLSAFACPNDAPIHGLACRQTSTPAPSGYWVWCPRPSLTDQTHTTPQLRRKNYVPASPGEYRQMEHTCMLIAPSGALLLTDIGCGTLPLAPPQTTRGNTHCLRLKPRQWQPRHV